MPSFGVWSIYLEIPLPAAWAWHVFPPFPSATAVGRVFCVRPAVIYGARHQSYD